MEDSDSYLLNLGDEEIDHCNRIDENILRYLDLSETAVIITLNGLTSLQEYQPLYETDSIINLLMVKSAKNVRFVVRGLKLGYYSGSSSVLRSAFEDLTFAVLFYSEPKQVSKWFRNEFSNQNTVDLNNWRSDQKKKAKQVLFSQENNKFIIRDALNEFVNKANWQIHTSIKGLSEEFGVELGNFLDEKLLDELEATKWNLTEALDKYVLKTYNKNCTKNNTDPKKSDEMVYFQLVGRYDKEVLSDIALFTFYIAHRLLDYSKEIFKIKDKEFLKNYKSWHNEIKDSKLDGNH
ncbi:MAG: hypothetical protein ACOWWR_17460 [Eubacteriales bacterium]